MLQAEEPALEVVPLQPAAPGSADGRPRDAPLLHGAVVRVDPHRTRRLVRQLIRSAVESGESGASLARLRSRRLDAVALVAAAIAHDTAAIERLAVAAGVEADALGVVAQLAATPLLRACASRLGEQLPPDWLNGFCPICGGWPAIAELRGLERNRRLRCGRCACDWPLPILRCPFCGEVRHDQLGSLLLEGEEQTRRVDTCKSCNGYIKTFTTLRAMAPRSIAFEDLATVALDLAAEERGYARPARPAYPLTITVQRSRPRAATAAASE